MRTMYATPEEHAANNPDTWVVEKNPDGGTRGKWVIRDLLGGTHGYWAYQTKREALAASTEGGDIFAKWTRESQWYQGEGSMPGMPSYADVLAEAEKAKVVARRKIEKLGVAVEKVDEWKAAVKVIEGERKLVHDLFETLDNVEPEDRDQAAADAASTRMEALDEALTAFGDMLELITGGTLVDLSALTEPEASELHSEVASDWGFGSPVEDRIHRIEYLGLDADKSALEVLHEMRDEERDERVATRRAA